MDKHKLWLVIGIFIAVVLLSDGTTVSADTDCAESDACAVDTDGDSIVDTLDNCPAMPNRPQADDDGDGVGNVCDPDAGLACTAHADCTVGECIIDTPGQVYSGFCLLDVGICASVTIPAGTPETICDDGKDNNCDGLTDCADPDCVGDNVCATFESCVTHCFVAIPLRSPNEDVLRAPCLNGCVTLFPGRCALNEHCTGGVCEFGYCSWGETIVSEVCTNGIDDDFDDLIDCADPDCVDDDVCATFEGEETTVEGVSCENNKGCSASEFCYSAICTSVPTALKALNNIVKKLPKKGEERLQRLKLITKFIKMKISKRERGMVDEVVIENKN